MERRAARAGPDRQVERDADDAEGQCLHGDAHSDRGALGGGGMPTGGQEGGKRALSQAVPSEGDREHGDRGGRGDDEGAVGQRDVDPQGQNEHGLAGDDHGPEHKAPQRCPHQGAALTPEFVQRVEQLGHGRVPGPVAAVPIVR